MQNIKQLKEISINYLNRLKTDRSELIKNVDIKNINFDPFVFRSGNNNVAAIGKLNETSLFIVHLVDLIRNSSGKAYLIDDVARSDYINHYPFHAFQTARFIEITPDICLNPFSMVDWELIKDDNYSKDSLIDSIKYLIYQICCPNAPINHDEEYLISLAVLEVLEKKGKEGNLESVAETLLLLGRNDQEKLIAQSLHLSLTTFIKKYGHFLSGQDKIITDNNFIIFGLSNLNGKKNKKLKSVIVLLLSFFVEQKILLGDRKSRSSLIFNKLDNLSNGNGLRLFIENFSRIIRIYNGSLVTCSKSINDYYKTPTTNVIFNNSDHKVFLAPNSSSINYIKNHLIPLISKPLERTLKCLESFKSHVDGFVINSNSEYQFIKYLFPQTVRTLNDASFEELIDVFCKEICTPLVSLHEEFKYFKSHFDIGEKLGFNFRNNDRANLIRAIIEGAKTLEIENNYLDYETEYREEIRYYF